MQRMSPTPDQATACDVAARLRKPGIVAGLLIAAATLADPSGAVANPTLQTLYSFTGGNDGANPNAELIMDGSGVLYSTTWDGGMYNDGVVFSLTPPAAGATAWTETVLYAFGSTSDDPQNSIAPLLMDGSGALYGTTVAGGNNGLGAVFRLTPPAARKTAWKETTLRSFATANTGTNPNCNLIMDGSGALYGTAQTVAFMLTPPASGKGAWTETELEKFTGRNGQAAFAGLIMDNSGALYGTTQNGGKDDDGVVFALTPPGAGTTAWAETVLYGFTGTAAQPRGADPFRGSLIMDGSGALYGTTLGGGKKGNGVVFKLTPPGAGQTAWTETVLHSFAGGNDGADPYSGLLMDGSGALYGTTSGGGTDNGGVVFKLTPPAAGAKAWAETVLYSFTGGNDGANPAAGLIMDGSGALYGTTNAGGTGNAGTVFKLTP